APRVRGAREQGQGRWRRLLEGDVRSGRNDLDEDPAANERDLVAVTIEEARQRGVVGLLPGSDDGLALAEDDGLAAADLVQDRSRITLFRLRIDRQAHEEHHDV